MNIRGSLKLMLLACCGLLFFAVGCKKQETMPINEESMIDVMVDVHFAEAAISHVALEKKDSIASLYYEQIYGRHNITGADFDTTMSVLKRNPLMMWKLYQKVLARIDEKAVDLHEE